MKIYIIADYAENFTEFENSKTFFNDHMYESEIIYIKDAISKLGHDCSIFGGIEQLIQAYTTRENLNADLFLNFSDGLSQNYSRLQAPILCELLGIKYSGSSPFSVALMNNKHYSKIAVEEIGIHTPKGFLISDSQSINKIKELKFPLILKPNTEGSSAGIFQDSIKYKTEDVIDSAEKLLQQGYEVLAEEYITGYEVTTLIIGNKNDIRINETIVYEFFNKLIHDNDVLDANVKANNTRHALSAKNIFSNQLCKEIEKKSVEIFNHFNAMDMARIDYRITETGEIYFIEINSQPGINKYSEGGFICKEKHFSFSDLYKEYIETCLKRYGLFNHG